MTPEPIFATDEAHFDAPLSFSDWLACEELACLVHAMNGDSAPLAAWPQRRLNCVRHYFQRGVERHGASFAPCRSIQHVKKAQATTDTVYEAGPSSSEVRTRPAAPRGPTGLRDVIKRDDFGMLAILIS